MDMENMPQKLVVEALGAFALCFFGIGAVILTQGGDVLIYGLAFGLAIGIMVAAAGHISGGHYNPAITLGFLAARRIPIPDAIAYIVAQLVGAVLGTAALTLVYKEPARDAVTLGLLRVGAESSTTNAVIMEGILTFFLVLVVFGTAVDNRSIGRWVAPLAIGLTIAIGHLAGAAVSGVGMNPARWFGPALLEGEFDDFWIWIVGPIVGGIVAAVLYSDFLLGRFFAGEVELEEIEIEEVTVSEGGAATTRRRTRRRR